MAADEKKNIFLDNIDKSMLNTIELFTEEKKTLLSGVLECAVCLELPKKKQKVMICEQGHHFCSDCHSMIEKCGICRGKLLKSRNFVVEELVTKLGPILGIKGSLPPPEAPTKYTPGSYQCQHDCPAKTPSHLMLSHIRSKHSSNLIDNMRSNPYNGDSSASFRFKYQLSVKLSSKSSSELDRQFSVSNCPVSNYTDDTVSIVDKGNILRIKESELLDYTNIGIPINIFFSVQKNVKGEKKKYIKNLHEIFPEKPLAFSNDRKIRRNRDRKKRKKRLKERFKNLNISLSDSKIDTVEYISKMFQNL